MPELFVSYCRDDAAVVEPIIENLRKLGFDLWIDTENLKPGTADWIQAIDNALLRVDGILAFLSPAAKKSKWCNRETLRAQEFDKPIYPILVYGDNKTAVPLHLVGAHYVDLRGRASREQNFDELARVLSHDFDLPLPEFDLKTDRSGQPVININVSGYVEGNINVVGGDVEGDVNIAGGDVVHTQVPQEPPADPTEQRTRTRPKWLNNLRVVVIGIGIIAGLGLIVSAAITGFFGLIPPETAESNATPTQPVEQMVTDTPEPVGTPLPPGFEPVTHNADWKPYTEVINGVEMALVPAGCFEMGSEDGDSDELPVHRVCFEEPFWIDVYEVTNEQYGGASFSVDSWGNDCSLRSSINAQPRICISWYYASVHCDFRGARLPTEAEWEYSARGPDGLTYPWGNDFIAGNVVYGANSDSRTWNVGSKPGGVSWIGAYDLSGNVWEWVNDWYGSYTIYQQVNPQGPSSGMSRVLRGGSWNYVADYVHTTYRNRTEPSDEVDSYGFRCARSYNP